MGAKLLSIIVLVLFCWQTQAGETKRLTSQFTGEQFEISVLDEASAQDLFKKIKSNTSIPFEAIFDGCYARTYHMILYAQLKQIKMAKRVVEVQNPMNVMIIPSDDMQWRLRWYYHVVPIVYVKLPSGEIEERIIDPGLFDAPVSAESFFERLLAHSEDVGVDTFILPKYVTEKDEISWKINLRKLDQTMLAQQAQILDLYHKYGAYHEKGAYYDERQRSWFQGGWPIQTAQKGRHHL